MTDGFITSGIIATNNTSWRSEESHPRYLRQVQYPDGRLELQGAYYWFDGGNNGMTWRPLPVVQVNERGESA